MNPFNVGFFTENELINFGFKSLGKNVCIAKNCTILGLENISIGSNVRIDGYTTIIASGNGFLNLGSFIHIGGYSLLSAGAGITMNDFSGISQGVKIYSKTDDYTGNYLTNPTVRPEYTGVTSGEVILGRHSIIGSGTVILPKLTIGEGTSVGALSLVTKSLSEWGVYFGSPVKKIKERNKELLKLEKKFLIELSKENP
ncbi:acyltransferase [Pectobacterium zantedeschiae]|uniref:Acyltransferase n=1 Tax=Pectobacterium zantedeschiae TaxID=2034769 RepID=A0A9X8P4Z6_9GAMM|nr:acyltransferase [Pectobacterium zantedeschiae]RYC43171.1 galactoside O-acetyltransferase [Pectobacterium zantedeschiae]RYC43914.1 acyltransferase [Pectobacterium zantedeschiae]RYC48865.1 galactoside O-acetyltransferase [Pectobacterium zantedeschiae]